jgi:hypothetical protein
MLAFLLMTRSVNAAAFIGSDCEWCDPCLGRSRLSATLEVAAFHWRPHVKGREGVSFPTPPFLLERQRGDDLGDSGSNWTHGFDFPHRQGHVDLEPYSDDRLFLR